MRRAATLLARAFAFATALLGFGCKFQVDAGPAPSPCAGLHKFTPKNPIERTADPFQPQAQSETAIVELPNTILVRHGRACTESQDPEKEYIVQLEGAAPLPPWTTDATVILNGWYARYLNTDRYVAGFGTLISDVSLDGGILHWKAAGGVGDDNFDDPYRWCYFYTVVAWNDAVFDVAPHEPAPRIPDSDCNFSGEIPRQHPDSAYSVLGTHLENAPFTGKRGVAVLPRGFGFLREAREVRQLAYHLDHGEHLVWRGTDRAQAQPPAGVYDTGHVSWESQAIFKDDGVKDYHFGEQIALVGGNGVGIAQPPFALFPVGGRPAGEACIEELKPEVRSEDFVFENLPYGFAVPMLSGWQLEYGCDDEYVQSMGIWIDEFQYDRASGRLTGRVKSVLGDHGFDDSFFADFKVSVLGLTTSLPDLVIVQPDLSQHFCRRDARGLFVVSVQNKGGGFAPPSTTHIAFPGSAGIQLGTPALSPGEVVDVFTDPPPPPCLTTGCRFQLTADYLNAVTESDEGNNVAPAQCP